MSLEKLQQFWIEAFHSNHDFKPVAKQSDKQSDKPQDENKLILDSIVSNGFKSDIIFHLLKNRMHEEEDIVRKLTGVMQFDITRNETKSVWSES